MPVYDQSYKHWEGSYKSHALRWWVITKYGIKTAAKKKAVKIFFMFALFPFIGGLVYVYGLTNLGKVAGFVKEMGGGGPMPELVGKTYEAEVSSGRQAFITALQEEGFQILQSSSEEGLRISVPDGENSKGIRAIAKASGAEITNLVPPGVQPNFYSGFLDWQTRYLFLLLLVVGAGLIAKDVKFNALQIYLAKPITGLDYILGKAGIIVLVLVLVTLVPGMLLFLFQAVLVGDSLYFRHYWWVPGAVGLYSLLIVFSGSLPILALSALSRNVRSATFGGAALYWFSPLVAHSLRGATGKDAYMLLSFRDNWTAVGAKVFRLKGMFDVRWEWSLLILVGAMVLSGATLIRKVRGVEVVK